MKRKKLVPEVLTKRITTMQTALESEGYNAFLHGLSREEQILFAVNPEDGVKIYLELAHIEDAKKVAKEAISLLNKAESDIRALIAEASKHVHLT